MASSYQPRGSFSRRCSLFKIPAHPSLDGTLRPRRLRPDLRQRARGEPVRRHATRAKEPPRDEAFHPCPGRESPHDRCPSPRRGELFQLKEFSYYIRIGRRVDHLGVKPLQQPRCFWRCRGHRNSAEASTRRSASDGRRAPALAAPNWPRAQPPPRLALTLDGVIGGGPTTKISHKLWPQTGAVAHQGERCPPTPPVVAEDRCTR